MSLPRVPVGYAPALAAGLSLGLFMVSWLVPLAGTLVSIWSPVPLALLYWRHGCSLGRRGMLIALIGTAVLLLVLPVGPIGLYYLFYAAMGMILGETAVRGLKAQHSIGLAALSAVAVITVVFLSLALPIGLDNLIDGWKDHWQSLADQVVAGMQTQSGEPDQRAKDLRNYLLTMGIMILNLAPGILTSTSLMLSWANFLLCRFFAKRFLPSEELPGQRMAEFRAPERMVWLLILGGILMVLASGGWFWLGANLIAILGVIYFFQGLAVLSFWLRKKNAPPMLRVGIYVLVVAEFFLLTIVLAVAGLFDLWFDFRRLKQEPAV